MNTLNPTLGPIDVQSAVAQIDLKLAKLLRSQAMAIRQ
jgi:hypothetical protein